jgi:phage protein U
MRPRAAVLASVVAALGFVAVPAAAVAAPHHNHGLTIAATPDTIVSGDAVLIYGQLHGTNVGGQTIVLYHRINPKPYFSVIGTTKTQSTGFYEFTRVEGVVLTNRSWFVRAPGLPGNIHSRTTHEKVAAEVSLAAPAAPTTGFLTNQQIVFTGAVAPDHAGQKVRLQEQAGTAGNDWKNVKGGQLNAASQFAIPAKFKAPGDYTLRVTFPGDKRNVAAASDSITVSVNQKEKPDFTINASPAIVTAGSASTVTGVLRMPGTTTPEPTVMVTLFGHSSGQSYVAIASTITGTDGSYTFTVTPQNNTEYQVRTSLSPARSSAQVYVGAQDVVSITPSSMTSAVGQSVTFTGSVVPDKAGHEIDLQRLGADGRYHVVAVGYVNVASAYQFTWTFGTPGTKTFRVHVPGGPDNVGGYSSTEAINVALPAVTSLPTAPLS